MALTGNTGPYLQYATARIRSIFRRAALDPAGATAPIQITADAERAFALLGFATVLRQVAETARLPARRASCSRWPARSPPSSTAVPRFSRPSRMSGTARGWHYRRAHPAGPADRAGPAWRYCRPRAVLTGSPGGVATIRPLGSQSQDQAAGPTGRSGAPPGNPRLHPRYSRARQARRYGQHA